MERRLQCTVKKREANYKTIFTVINHSYEQGIKRKISRYKNEFIMIISRSWNCGSFFALSEISNITQ